MKRRRQSKDSYERHNQLTCESKKRFHDAQSANHAARLNLRTYKVQTYPYRCPHCFKWHLSKRRQDDGLIAFCNAVWLAFDEGLLTEAQTRHAVSEFRKKTLRKK